MARDEHLRAAPVKHLDEARWRRAGRWLWLAADTTCTLFHLDRERGLHGLQRLLGLEDKHLALPLEGLVISDRYGLYERILLTQRGLCWAHLKRDFVALAQGPPAQRCWGQRLLKVQELVFACWHDSQEQRGKKCLGSHSEAGCRFVERMLSVIQSGTLQGRSALQFCQQTLYAYRRGLPTPSLLPAPSAAK